MGILFWREHRQDQRPATVQIPLMETHFMLTYWAMGFAQEDVERLERKKSEELVTVKQATQRKCGEMKLKLADELALETAGSALVKHFETRRLTITARAALIAVIIMPSQF